MKSSALIFPMAALPLMLAAVACSFSQGAASAPSPAPTLAPSPSPTPTMTPSLVERATFPLPDDASLYDCESLTAFGGGAIKGYGGYRKVTETSESGHAQEVLYVYLLDPTNEDALETTWCSWGRDGTEIRIIQADYSLRQISDWYRSFHGVYQVPGISWTDIDEPKGRIRIGFAPKRDTRAKLEAVIDSLGIPRDAVIIESGCGSLGEARGPFAPAPTPIPTPTYERARFLQSSLDVPTQVAYGETVPMKLTVKNVGSETITLGLGDEGRASANFIVSKSDGKEIWNWLCGKFFHDSLAIRPLKPGEEIQFTGEWEQVDWDSGSIPPGTYTVRASFDSGFNRLREQGDTRHEQVLVSEVAVVEVLP
ncbi:MAG: BsuPI-related putative proteinase inhibitor [Chloroflexi bacterium]|nr:BsuPI-related putative proteinase inhibitor [Chloroflexota bacterium]